MIHTRHIIGIDEAGRGPFIGRVYASCVVYDKDYKDDKEDNKIIKSIIDSKKMTPKKRMLARQWIFEHSYAHGTGYAESKEIDELNIIGATRLAMSRALENMRHHFPNTRDLHDLIIDGIRWEGKFPGENVKSIVKGDSTHFSISSASILAKEAHDEHIRELCVEHPEWNEKYDLANNMGYGTKKHLEGLKKYGVCEQHRMSFSPCKNI